MKSKKAYPSLSKGTKIILGMKIDPAEITFTAGIDHEKLIQNLKQAAKKDLFPLPSLMANE